MTTGEERSSRQYRHMSPFVETRPMGAYAAYLEWLDPDARNAGTLPSRADAKRLRRRLTSS